MNKEIFSDLEKAVISYDAETSEKLVKEIVEKKLDLLKAIDAMTSAVRNIGERFGKGELFLPDLVGASTAMLRAMPILERELKKKGGIRKSLGTVVVGTVYGDIHSIGKSMVATLLVAAGFVVHDLGMNIKPEEFIKAIEKYNADILAMSALMTTTAPEQKKVIDEMKRIGLRKKVKVIVGGAAITEEFADSIGADGYDPTAPGAVGLVKALMSKGSKEY